MREPEPATTDENEIVVIVPNRADRRRQERGSREHVSRMSGRKKAWPSIATHLAVRLEDGTLARVPHPAWQAHLLKQKREAVTGAHPEQDAGESRQR